MKERIVVIAAFVLLAGGALGVFLATHERADVEVFVPAQGEARRNPLLAADTLLTQLGYEVTTGDDFAPRRALPDTADTLVLVHGYAGMEFEVLQRVLDWVEAGGHLIVPVADSGGYSYDPLLTPLGIRSVGRTYYYDEPPDRIAQDDGSGDSAVDAAPAPPPMDIDITPPRVGGDNDDSDGTARLAPESADAPGLDVVPADAAANHDASGPPADRRDFGVVPVDNGLSIDFGSSDTIWTIADEYGSFAGQIGYGKGVLTLAADLAIAINSRIGEGDNAFILTRLIGPADRAGRVWIYSGQHYPSLWTLLWDNAGFLIKALAALLLLYLWYAAQRFGPLIPAPPVARKAFMEHIAASGRYLWRSRKHGVLLGNAQQEFLHDYERRHPAGRALEGSERVRHVARVCDMPEETVHNALREPGERHQGEFVSALSHLQTMWKKL